MSCLFVGSVSSINLPVLIKPLGLGYNKHVHVDVFPDPGADVCLVGHQQLQQLGISTSQLNCCSRSLDVAGGYTMLATGWFKAEIVLNSKTSIQTIYLCNKEKRFFFLFQHYKALGFSNSDVG